MKERLDIILVERRLTESRTKAHWLIKNGYVLVNGTEIRKPGKKIDNTLQIQLKRKFPYVGRGGLKLESAIKEFSISIETKVCVDIGASIGGFTDCLIKHGASKVYAIDTAKNFLHPSLRCEKMKNRVIPLLGTDARSLINIEEKMDICTIDVTFTSLRDILPKARNFLKENGDIIALVKPLFETNFYQEDKLKIIQDSKTLYQILADLMKWSISNEIYPYGIIKSPLLGKGGSIEFLIFYKIDKESPNFEYEKSVRLLIVNQ